MTSSRGRFRADVKATIDAWTGVEEQRLLRQRIAADMLIAPHGSIGSLAHLLPFLWRSAAPRWPSEGSNRHPRPAEKA